MAQYKLSEGELVYAPNYLKSHALIVGVSKYKTVSCLANPARDAVAFGDSLVSSFDFPASNVVVLIDHEASKTRILSEFLRMSKPEVCDPDDRFLFFFAGHGHTVTGRREVGFLVPEDGNLDDISSLIRWDELVRNAELVRAKHLFFIIDSCYGGLALQRKGLTPGSSRLLKDMLQRYSRQVLTAGKADETVSDADGTRAGHSIFTSHVLDAFDELKAQGEGIVCASSLMSYVYQKVGNDTYSQQTPHHGHVDGDGDFIFNPPLFSALSSHENDLIIDIPTVEAAPHGKIDIVDRTKTLLSDPSQAIALEDFVNLQIKAALADLPSQLPPNYEAGESFVNIIEQYERAVDSLAAICVLIAKWGKQDQILLLQKVIRRIAEVDRPREGLSNLIALTWYPSLYLFYAAGVAAMSQDRYDVLLACFNVEAQISSIYTRSSTAGENVLDVTVNELTRVVDSFKLMPGYERHVTPRSDYLFQRLQAVIEDSLFLGKSYASAFDRFEVMLALTFADHNAGDNLEDIWGPPGRFYWQHKHEGSNGPYGRFVAQERKNSKAVTSGFFRGSHDRFKAISSAYQEKLNS